MMRWDRWDLKPTDSDSGNCTPFPYDSCLSHTIHAFLRQSQPWTNHKSRLAIKKKPKTPFPKRKKQNPSFTPFRKRKRVLIRVTVLNPKYGGAARI
jgi:hypothetical protein